jgi:hypothetical protein
MRYLVENPENGERQNVESLEGYDGWTILAKGSKSEPKEYHRFKSGRWIHDPEMEQAIKDETIISGLTLKELKILIKQIVTEIISE